MSYISTAVGTERKSRVSGYKINKGFFSNETSNLPQIIAILAEPNLANIPLLASEKREITSAQEAGRIYGFGSPIHQIMRILRPMDSDGVGGIPTVVFPQIDKDATQTVLNFTVSGEVTKSTTHSLRIAGRESLDYSNYSYSLLPGDTAGVIATKMSDCINKAISCPVIAKAAGSVLTLTSKWAGGTGAELKVRISNEADDSGITYSLTSRTDGVNSGIVDLQTALEQFGETHFTCVINSYGIAAFDILEQFNGSPIPESPTGRYQPTVFKPFMAFFGETSMDPEDYVNLTAASARINEVTNVLCPAPNSSGFPWEAAANVVRLFARTMQDYPESDVNGMWYPDMPAPVDGNIGEIADYNVRDSLVKKGSSTVILNRGMYEIQDLVTTYHPEGENPLQFNYCRNLNLDWNIADAYKILETRKVKDKVLIKDDQVTSSTKAIKPKEWKAVLYDFFDDLAEKALINEPSFSKESVRVEVPQDNPNRINCFFRYKRTGVARIESTTVEAGF